MYRRAITILSKALYKLGGSLRRRAHMLSQTSVLVVYDRVFHLSHASNDIVCVGVLSEIPVTVAVPDAVRPLAMGGS